MTALRDTTEAARIANTETETSAAATEAAAAAAAPGRRELAGLSTRRRNDFGETEGKVANLSLHASST